MMFERRDRESGGAGALPAGLGADEDADGGAGFEAAGGAGPACWLTRAVSCGGEAPLSCQ